jgi:hypothetical protein
LLGRRWLVHDEYLNFKPGTTCRTPRGSTSAPSRW